MVKEGAFELSGGRLCLDFVNTVENRPATPRELLLSYSDLLSLSEQAGILSPEEARRLSKLARARPRTAKAALHRARKIRESLFALFSRGDRSALEALRPDLSSAYRRPALRTEGGYALVWEDDPRALDRMLGPVLRSSIDLLTSRDLDRVKVCGASDCDWLFLDESRNRSRQWCDMTTCGNRSKAKRFYRRQRALKRRGNRGELRSGGTRRRPSRG